MKRTRPSWTGRLHATLGVGGYWRHEASGWVVYRCGHPTALWPYYGMRLLAGGWGLGRGFSKLARAQAAVEAELAKEGFVGASRHDGDPAAPPSPLFG